MAKKKETTAPAPVGAEEKAAKAAKRAAAKAKRLEALKNRPAIQRTNSKQIDVIEIEGSGKVLNFGYAIRKTGTLITSVALNPAGEIVSTSVTLIAGTKVKVKRGHGNVIPGLAGVGKDEKEDEDVDDEVEDEGEED